MDRASTATGAQTTTGSNVGLFTTPNEFTVNNQGATWRFYIANSGDGNAYNVLVTNTLPIGYQFITYTLRGSNAPTATTSYVTGLNAVGRQVVTWTIPTLPPGGRLEFTPQSTAVYCSLPDSVTIGVSQTCGALNGVCQGNLLGRVSLVQGTTSLLSSNTQTANFGLCDRGEIQLRTKNSSGAAELYNFTITDTLQLRHLHYANGSCDGDECRRKCHHRRHLRRRPAEHPLHADPGEQHERADVDLALSNFITGTTGYDVLTKLAASDQVLITFQVSTTCASTLVSAQSAVASVDACQKTLTTTEKSKSLLTDIPELQVSKLVRNATLGGSFGSTVFAGVGDTVVWQGTVQNTGRQRVTNLFIEDQVPSQYTVTATSPVTSSQTSTPPPLLKWHEFGGQTLAVGASSIYLVTGTVASNACTISTTNVIRASYGCAVGDKLPDDSRDGIGFLRHQARIHHQPAGHDHRSVRRRAGHHQLRQQRRPRPERGCDLHLAAAAWPTTGWPRGATPTTTLVYSPAIGATGVITWMYSAIDTLVTTNTLRFNVKDNASTLRGDRRRSPTSADHTLPGHLRAAVRRCDAQLNTLTVQASNIHRDPGADHAHGRVGQIYTWTITITNTGNSPTNNLVVTETLGSGWGSILAASDGVGGTPAARRRSSRATSSRGMSWAAWPPAAVGPPPSGRRRSTPARTIGRP